MQYAAKPQHPLEAALAAVPFVPVENTGSLKRDSYQISRSILGNGKHKSQVSLLELAEFSDRQIRDTAGLKARRAKFIVKEVMTECGGEIGAYVGAMVDGWRDAYVQLVIWNNGFVLEPDTKKLSNASACKRFMSERWWRRRLRVKQAREVERKALEMARVNQFKETYSSDRTVARRAFQRDNNSRILENINAVNELGQEYTLKALQDLSTANPTLRRIEFMTRIRGFEEYAKLWGDHGEFYTITCPSKMHPSPKKCKGGKNKKWDGSTPRDAQKYLSKQWEKVRAKLHRNGVEVYGFRVVEPQHDGTPHWHMLLFANPNHVLFIRSVMLEYALEVDGDEKGAHKYRFKPVAIKTGINPNTGREYSAAGYIAKYIAKAIDGFSLETDLYGNDAAAASRRIEAWASTWGIRQFQQIGGPSVTVWRELRRLGDEEVCGSELLERARQCANDGDWCGYCQLNWFKEVELMKRELDGVGEYGDDLQMTIYGVQAGSVGVVTRPHIWEIGQAPQGGDCLAQAAKPSSTWTSVNNCTQSVFDTALNQFNERYAFEFAPKVRAAEKWGFDVYKAYETVKAKAMIEIIGGQVSISQLDSAFIESLTREWVEHRPREMLLEDFDEQNVFGDMDFGEFCGDDLADFIRSYIWEKWCVALN